MKKAIKIGEKKPHPLYVPLDLVNDGFIGETYLLANAKTATIIRPGATLDEIEESLEIILKDIRLRKKSKAHKGSLSVPRT